MMTFCLIMMVILLTAFGQTFMKLGANKSDRLILNKYVIVGYGLFGIVACTSIWLMNFLPLKSISMIMSFNYPATILISSLILGEKITKQVFAACCLIVMGCVIFNL